MPFGQPKTPFNPSAQPSFNTQSPVPSPEPNSQQSINLSPNQADQTKPPQISENQQMGSNQASSASFNPSPNQEPLKTPSAPQPSSDFNHPITPPQPSMTNVPAEENMSSYKWIIGILAVIVVILIFLPSKTGRDEQTPDATTDQSMSIDTPADTEAPAEEPIVEPFDGPAEEPASEISGTANFNPISPGDWDLKDRVLWSVNRLAEGQQIQYGIVQDPTNQDQVYFATSKIGAGNSDSLISIYIYNTKDAQWRRLFRNTYLKGKAIPFSVSVNLPVFHVLGYDNGNLVIFVRDLKNSLDSCSQPLLTGYRNKTLFSMDIAQPYSGLHEYTPSEEIVKHAEALQAECEKKS